MKLCFCIVSRNEIPKIASVPDKLASRYMMRLPIKKKIVVLYTGITARCSYHVKSLLVEYKEVYRLPLADRHVQDI